MCGECTGRDIFNETQKEKGKKLETRVIYRSERSQ
jgi:hypothetical protein